MTATCRTTDCPEVGVPKELGFELAEGEDVLCGACGHPCDVADDGVD